MSSLVGQIIGQKYEILSSLGTGGMGTVYKARDVKLGRTVAIKAMHIERDANPKDRERFVREARSLAMLEHSNVLPIYELLEHGDTYYMVMQFVSGGTLTDRIRQNWQGELPQGLSPEFVVNIVAQAARALDYAHNQGIIHRDIKPGNILLTEDGRTLLGDFGIAKWTGVTRDESLTAEGASVGTPAYMSPEQINAFELGPPSDIYALAIVTYEMLTGRPPFEGSPISVIHKQINEAPPRPTDLNADIPSQVELVLLKALEKDPANRYARAGEFATALQAAYEPIIGKVDVSTSPLTERIREGAFWGWLTRQRARRVPGEKQRLSPLVRLMWGFARTLLIIAVVLALLGVLALFGLSFALSKIAEVAVANGDWQFGEYEATYTETELTAKMTEAVNFSLPGVLKEIRIDFDPPDSVGITAVQNNDNELSLSGTMTINELGRPITSIRYLNNFPLTVFGSIISGGINRGFGTALDESDGSIDEMIMTDDGITFRMSGVPLAGATPEATPTRGPMPTPTPWVNDAGYALAQDAAEHTMVYIPGGAFEMGSRSGGNGDEYPAHLVSLSEYWLDQHEVSNRQYQACVEAGVCEPPNVTRSATRNIYYGEAEFNNFPVVFVTWSDAKIFCTWRDARLPTEAEWEFAARGSDSLLYPWGDAVPTCGRANYANCSFRDTQAVGGFGAGRSPFGIYQMAGNVWEWVADWYGTYPSDALVDPAGPDSGYNRVARGGAFNLDAFFLRAAARMAYPPNNAYDNVGFRCARSTAP